MKHCNFLFFCLLLLTTQMTRAQTYTRFYLQDFGKVSNYNPAPLLPNNYNGNTSNSYNAIFNSGSVNGVTSLTANSSASFTSYDAVSPIVLYYNSSTSRYNWQVLADGAYSITQYSYGTNVNNATPNSINGNNTATYYVATYGTWTSTYDHTTGGVGGSNVPNGENSTKNGLFLYVNADPTHRGVQNGTYFEFPLAVLNIPGATYNISTWWRDMDGPTSSYYGTVGNGDQAINLPVPAFIGCDVNTGAHGTGSSLKNFQNSASAMGANATASQYTSSVPRSTTAGSWQQLADEFVLPTSFSGNTLYFNFYNSSPRTDNNTYGNDIGVDDIELSMKTINSLSGTVYTNDGDGNGTSTVTHNGTTTPLYAVLVDKNNKVIQSVAVANDGTYTLVTNQSANKFIPYGDNSLGLHILLSTSQPVVGTANFTASTLPVGLVNTGHHYAGQSFIRDKTDAVMAVTQTTSNSIAGADFYIEHAPVANDVTNSQQYQPVVGSEFPVTLNGTDVEDGASDITATSGGTIVTITIPNGSIGQVWYNGSQLTGSTTISNFSPSALSIKLTGSGYTSTSFSYYFTDKAGQPSSPATYTLKWAYALPVKYTRELKLALVPRGILLSWTTGQEVNNKGFNILLSKDGSNFSTVGYVGSLAQGGNSSSSLDYTYTDAISGNGTYYYYLKQIDLDGVTASSNIQHIYVNGTGNGVSIAPNPVVTSFNLSNAKVGSILKIVNLSGVVVKTATVTANNTMVNVSSLASGLYILQTKTESGNDISLKFFKQ